MAAAIRSNRADANHALREIDVNFGTPGRSINLNQEESSNWLPEGRLHRLSPRAQPAGFVGGADYLRALTAGLVRDFLAFWQERHVTGSPRQSPNAAAPV